MPAESSVQCVSAEAVLAYPHASAGLQACEYLLWALQRFDERDEEGYLQAMWLKLVRILDLDVHLQYRVEIAFS